MEALGLSIVITTYNRINLVGRAIESALSQSWEPLEIIVVDDASTDGTGDYISETYPTVRYFKQKVNQGPGPARNLGLMKAKYSWVIILDDDDWLLPDALNTIGNIIHTYAETTNYPVIQCARTNGKLKEDYLLIKPQHYFNEEIAGDFTPIIQRDKFLKQNYSYPQIKIGGENLLWLDIANNHGIPTWANKVVELGKDATNRLTSYYGQIKRAREYAELQDMILEKYYILLKDISPAELRKRQLGSATYWLLAGERETARQRIKKASKYNRMVTLKILWILSYMPITLVRWLFIMYRNWTI